MKLIRTFTVTPSLPASLEGLHALAYNLRWAWDHDAIELFRRRVSHDLDAYLPGEYTWFTKTHGRVEDPLAAYFKAEFGIPEVRESDALFLKAEGVSS